jgi:hypothetical protein
MKRTMTGNTQGKAAFLRRNSLRLLRRSVRRLAQMIRWHRLDLAEVPALFANSFPKSGTHLLTQVLEGFPKLGPAVNSGLPAVVTFEGDTGRERSVAEIMADLRRLGPGDLAYGHVHAFPDVVAELRQPRYAAYFILRDPRDVVVSHVHYVTEMEPRHIHHTYYSQVLRSFDERLATSIQGIPAGSDFAFLPDVRARFEPFLGWMGLPEVLVLRFEEFLVDRRAALGRVLDHAVGRGFPLAVPRPQALAMLEQGIDPRRSPTFRSGKAGGWRHQFTPQHVRLLKDIAADLLVRLGYEENNDW